MHFCYKASCTQDRKSTEGVNWSLRRNYHGIGLKNITAGSARVLVAIEGHKLKQMKHPTN